jgi:hypothetical protein
MQDSFVLRSRRLTALVLELAVACAITAACDPAEFSPSHPLAPGAEVKATFNPSRGLDVGTDSTHVVTELSGRVLQLRGDTMRVKLTRVAGPRNPRSWMGHEVEFVRDSTTTLVKTNVDTPVGTLAVVGGVAAFLAYMMGK